MQMEGIASFCSNYLSIIIKLYKIQIFCKLFIKEYKLANLGKIDIRNFSAAGKSAIFFQARAE